MEDPVTRRNVNGVAALLNARASPQNAVERLGVPEYNCGITVKPVILNTRSE